VFEIFQNEWELSMAAFVESKIEGPLTIDYCIGISRFGVDTHLDKYFKVVVNHTDQMIICSCNKFKRVGVLCGHALKVFDVMNVKLIPEKYFLQRWTRDARSEIVEDFNGKIIVENPKLDSTNRYRALARKLLKLASKAADFEEVSQFVDAACDILSKEVEEKIQNLSINGVDITSSLHQPNHGPKEGCLMEKTEASISFKKREGRKSGKRLESWVHKLRKVNKKISQYKGAKGS
jgi:zinc finger SWIM domain-containing protein 3